VTYHVWGVGAFSPDTTEKAMEVENKWREIMRSLPPDHPQRRRAEQLGQLSPLTLGDVKRSRYWYRKWHITPPRREVGTKLPSFKLPNSPPLCGEGWLARHLKDHTAQEIGALAIEVACDGRWLSPVSMAERGKLRKMMREV